MHIILYPLRIWAKGWNRISTSTSSTSTFTSTSPTSMWFLPFSPQAPTFSSGTVPTSVLVKETQHSTCHSLHFEIIFRGAGMDAHAHMGKVIWGYCDGRMQVVDLIKREGEGCICGGLSGY
ncbi:hypothetical protein M431DRAFT_497413 [Trichoderma harzianum CBS 226.95]|uniref:Uncharacterized protein n=1 Tax=Trichoderma harzianum CBS 226.95 TaxID=983964 RepID=A0A2T4A4W9_TRIHA|nr:hypothetical protein M431DRAFT_497413 [Trichoderma harzianum CBS 226.95]PTB52111.1 hypothetical protein M431DRAFT_497413 [Trichoderma harzianum CBS 226.95]